MSKDRLNSEEQPVRVHVQSQTPTGPLKSFIHALPAAFATLFATAIVFYVCSYFGYVPPWLNVSTSSTPHTSNTSVTNVATSATASPQEPRPLGDIQDQQKVVADSPRSEEEVSGGIALNHNGSNTSATNPVGSSGSLMTPSSEEKVSGSFTLSHSGFNISATSPSGSSGSSVSPNSDEEVSGGFNLVSQRSNTDEPKTWRWGQPHQKIITDTTGQKVVTETHLYHGSEIALTEISMNGVVTGAASSYTLGTIHGGNPRSYTSGNSGNFGGSSSGTNRRVVTDVDLY